MIRVIPIAILMFGSVILLSVLTTKYIIHKVIKKIILPDLQTKGLTFSSYKWLGYFNQGDFGIPEFVFKLTSSNGNPAQSIFVNIFYLDQETEKQVTVRIDTLFFFIRHVVYSAQLQT